MTILANTQPAFALTHDDDHGHRGHHNGGISDKDQTVFSSVNAARDTRDTTHDLSRQVGSLESGLLSAVYKNTFDLSINVEKNGAANQLATNVQGAANNLAIEKTAAATTLIVEKSIAATNLAVQVSSAEGRLLAVQNAGATALAAATNNAAVLAAMAACCCEIKERVREDGEATRTVIRDNEMHGLREKLSQAQTAITVANARIATAPIVV